MTLAEELIQTRMPEWDNRGPDRCPDLVGRFLEGAAERELAERLARERRLEVTELRSGLMVRSFSHVGAVRLGGIEIVIEPKIDHAAMLGLLRYAYGFRGLRLFPEATSNLDRSGFADLMIAQLLAEVGELVSRGLHRDYVARDEWLATPRGRIDLGRLATRGGAIDAALPCGHHPRIENILINQAIQSGLAFAATVAGDLALRREARRLVARLGERVTPVRLDADALDRADHEVNRLTAAYAPALTLIRMLWDARGVSLDAAGAALELPGFLFDMNRFFQALLSRFLKENLSNCLVEDERRWSNLMRFAAGYDSPSQRPPTLRPDFVVKRSGRLIAVLDAKYRDLWREQLPRDMLYQLVVYAIGTPRREAAILYPTTDAGAKEVRIDVADPTSGHRQARVAIRPVVLSRLADLIDANPSPAVRRSRTAFAKWLATGE